jgi:hypothetical protein
MLNGLKLVEQKEPGCKRAKVGLNGRDQNKKAEGME